MSDSSSKTTLLNLEPARKTFRDEVLAGLRDWPPHLPCKYFYDARGSQLFDDICELDEYYLTRSELAIMRSHAHEMAAQIGDGAILVEYGSGSSVKTRLLLDHLPNPAAYVPVDISRTHLQQTADQLSEAYPHIEVLPVCADFTEQFDLPDPQRDSAPERDSTHVAVYFPGSTIGNFQPAEVRKMLVRIAELCGSGGGLLIGIDLQKDVRVIEAAYNDAQGLTSEFNLNLLRRINRELDGDFDLEQFAHRAVYAVEPGRVEISLVSQRDQRVTIGGEAFDIAEGESIHTEYSYKYTIDGWFESSSQLERRKQPFRGFALRG